MQHADLRQQPLPQLQQVFHDLYDFEAGGDGCGEEAKDVLGIVGAVGALMIPSRLSVLTRHWSMT